MSYPLKHLQSYTVRLMAATTYAGFLHGLAQPCLKLTLHLLPNHSAPSDSADLFDESLLVPMTASRSLRVSASIAQTEEITKHWPELKLALERCHQLLVRVQESAGWTVSAGAVISDFAPLQPMGWTVSMCCPSLHPSVLIQALPWLMARLGDDRAPPVALNKAPQTVEGLLALLSQSAPPGTNTRLLLAAAYEAGVPVQRLAGSVMQYGWGCRSRWMDSSFTDATSNIAARLARDKVASHQLLRQAGFPVAQQITVFSLEQAVAQALKIGYPVVIKPSNLDGGRGVEAGLKNETALRAAYTRALEHSKSLILERHIEGRDFRLGVLNGELAWATYREPAGIRGNGVSTLDELINEANRDPRRGTQHWSQMVPLTINAEAKELLCEQGISLPDIVEHGRFVQLRRSANVSSGGRPKDVSQQVHPDNAALAVAVARLFRLDIAGIDFITPDIERSWRQVGGVVCEVNSQPQFSPTRPDIPGRVLSVLLEHRGRIPVVLILGQVASGQWTSLMTQRLQAGSIKPGWVLADGAFSGKQALASEGNLSFNQVRALLMDTSLGAVVMATNGLEWLESGMPVDQVDLVISNGTEDARVLEMLKQCGVGQWWQEPDLHCMQEISLKEFSHRLIALIFALAKDNRPNLNCENSVAT